MLKLAKMTEKEKKNLIEAAASAIKVDNLLIRKGEKKGPYCRFYKSHPNYQNHLHIFGEQGVMTNKTGREIKAKLEDRGKLCTFIGYARNHSRDTYRMKNNTTREIHITQDVKWIGTDVSGGIANTGERTMKMKSWRKKLKNWNTKLFSNQPTNHKTRSYCLEKFTEMTKTDPA